MMIKIHIFRFCVIANWHNWMIRQYIERRLQGGLSRVTVKTEEEDTYIFLLQSNKYSILYPLFFLPHLPPPTSLSHLRQKPFLKKKIETHHHYICKTLPPFRYISYTVCHVYVNQNKQFLLIKSLTVFFLIRCIIFYAHFVFRYDFSAGNIITNSPTQVPNIYFRQQTIDCNSVLLTVLLYGCASSPCSNN